MSKPLALVGPSGSGKSTLIRFLLSKSSEFKFSVSSTTRNIRPKEVNGKDYYFITKHQFENNINRSEFIEWAEVHGNFYGTTKTEISNIAAEGKICVLDIDVQGVLNLYNSGFDFNRICILPIDENSIRQRLLKRKSETEESLKLRLENMRNEITVMKTYPQIFNQFIVNDDLNVTKSKILEIVKNLYPFIKTQ